MHAEAVLPHDVSLCCSKGKTEMRYFGTSNIELTAPGLLAAAADAVAAATGVRGRRYNRRGRQHWAAAASV